MKASRKLIEAVREQQALEAFRRGRPVGQVDPLAADRQQAIVARGLRPRPVVLYATAGPNRATRRGQRGRWARGWPTRNQPATREVLQPGRDRLAAIDAATDRARGKAPVG